MAPLQKTVFVLGATGQQGGATTRHLLAKGWRVRAFSRDPNQLAVQVLRRAGAEVIQGDADDRALLEEAMQDVYGVFCVLPIGDDEARQGKNVVDAAQAVGVQHFVYSSVIGAERLFHHGTNVNKWQLEQYLQKHNLPATILRPAMFMDLFVGPPFGVSQGRLASAIKSDVALPLIAVDDIGAFAALAFDHPNTYIGKTIEIAGDVLTLSRIAAEISRATGRSIPYVQLPIETIRQQNADFARALDRINEGGGDLPDIPALCKLHPDLMPFDVWLVKEGKERFESFKWSKHA
ncbi:NmrA/HSCARG family protein [Ktedonobacter robiniae]|uniref:NmrA-like domain-containing protein n=1 Tax=Ktedonobacter robiniae TaxID=2778365 RepID=A0ABQ3UYS5_9CHLR|nr:NmrA/HSCARG family protein [Ktedonobacter robiniae]GHO57833.1 hypothetical protein KSB_63080 [Ktedonobacter robiniae]